VAVGLADLFESRPHHPGKFKEIHPGRDAERGAGVAQRALMIEKAGVVRSRRVTFTVRRSGWDERKTRMNKRIG
jgi:hypothetical protein